MYVCLYTYIPSMPVVKVGINNRPHTNIHTYQHTYIHTYPACQWLKLGSMTAPNIRGIRKVRDPDITASIIALGIVTPGWRTCMYVRMYIYMCVCTYTHIYIYIYIHAYMYLFSPKWTASNIALRMLKQGFRTCMYRSMQARMCMHT